MTNISVRINDSIKTIDSFTLNTKDNNPTVITGTENVNYQLIDESTGFAPEHIVTTRVGNDLHISLDPKSPDADLIIKDFYADDFDAALIGQAEDGYYYFYIPDTGKTEDYVTELADGDVEGQALGGEQQVTPWWIADADFDILPWLVGLGVLTGGLIAAKHWNHGGDNNNNGDAVDNTAPEVAVTVPENTNDKTPDITVNTNLPEGSEVTVEIKDDNGKVVDEITGKVDENGDVTITPSTDLGDGEYEVIAKGEDAAGNETITKPETVVVDTTSPEVTVTVPENTNDKTPEITVNTDLPKGSEVTVEIKDDNGKVVDEITGKVDENGDVTITPSTDLGDGEYEVIAKGEDAAGNETITKPETVVVDTTSPEVAVTVPENTNDKTPDITVNTNLPEGSEVTVEIKDDNGKVVDEITGKVDKNGDVTITPSTDLGDGEYEVIAKGEDAAGNETITKPETVVVDTTSPEVAVTVPENTNDKTPDITVNTNLPEGSEVTVEIKDDNGKVVDEITGKVDENGDVTITPSTDLGDGEYEVIAKGEDAAGNETITKPETVVVDTTSPEVAVTVPENTNDKTPDITVNTNLPKGSEVTVEIKDDNGKVVDEITGKVDENGDVTITPSTDLGDGEYEVIAKGEDAAGNETITKPETVVVDTTSPEVAVTVPENTNDKTPDITVNTNLPEGSEVTVEIKDDNGKVVDEITGKVDENGDVTITPSTDLGDGEYEVIAKGEDAAGNETITKPETVVVDTTSNDAPVIEITEPVTPVEGTTNGDTVIAKVTVTDEDTENVKPTIKPNTPAAEVYEIDEEGNVTLTPEGVAKVEAGEDLPKIEVTATDGTTSVEAEKEVPATTDVNDAPVIEITEPVTPVEGTTNGDTVIAKVTVTDEDTENVKPTIKPNTPAAEVYEIDEEGNVTLTPEGIAKVEAGEDLPKIEVTATDGENAVEAEKEVPATTDVNDAPVIEITEPVTPVEGTTNGDTVIAKVTVTDEDTENVKPTIKPNTPAAEVYEIDEEGNVTLTPEGVAKVEAGEDLPKIEVTATDGENAVEAEKEVPATTDVNDAPVIEITEPVTPVEGTTNGDTVIAKVTVTDEDTENVKPTIKPNTPAAEVYEIDEEGNVTLTPEGVAKVEAGEDLPKIEVTATDGTTSVEAEKEVPATTDVNDAPVIEITEPVTPVEGTTNGDTVIAKVTVTDEDTENVKPTIKPNTPAAEVYEIDEEGNVTLTPEGVAKVEAGEDLPKIEVTATDGTTSVEAEKEVPATTDVNDAPVIEITEPVTPVEGTTNGDTVIAKVTVTDEDTENVKPTIKPNTPAAEVYEIDEEGNVTLTPEGVAKVEAGEDLPKIEVTATDGTTSVEAEKEVPATTDVNDAPVIEITEPVTPVEGTTNGDTVIAKVTVTDEDTENVKPTIKPNTPAAEVYEIDEEGNVTLTPEGVAKVEAGEDLPKIEVTATDGTTSVEAEKEVPATTDVNDAPVIEITEPVTPVEGTTNGDTVIAKVTVTDEDTENVKPTIKPNTPAAEVYEIDEEGNVTLTPEGVAKVEAGENLPKIEVTATDGTTSVEAEKEVPATTDVNDAPVIEITEPVTPVEGTTNGDTVIAKVTVTDEDTENVKPTIKPNTPAAEVYEIDEEGNVTLTPEGVAKVEAGEDLPKIEVTATDGTTSVEAEKEVPATTDVNDAPVIEITEPVTPVEGTTNGDTVIAKVTVTDEDTENVKPTIKPNTPAAEVYEIDEEGNVTLTPEGVAKVEAGEDLPKIEVTATDGTTSVEAEKEVPATTDVNDAPVIEITEPVTPVEGTTNGDTVIAKVTVTDEDTENVKPTIKPNTPAAEVYEIDEEGNVTLTPEGIAKVEAGEDLPKIEVTATDGENTVEAEKEVPATTDINDTPTLTITTIQPTEGKVTVGSKVADFVGHDEETADQNLTYHITDNNPDYKIVGNTVVLTEAGAAKVNRGDDLSPVKITVTDEGHLTANASENVGVTLDEAPTQTVVITKAVDDVEANTGDLTSGSTTNDANPVLHGTISEALGLGEVVKIYDDSTYLGEATVSGTTWTFEDHNLTNEQTRHYKAKVVDAANNAGPESNQFNLTVDSSAPEVTINDITTDNTIDKQEAKNGFDISGTTTVEDNQTVTVSILDKDQSVLKTYHTNAEHGRWNINVNADADWLEMGSDVHYTVKAEVSDKAGNAATPANQAITSTILPEFTNITFTDDFVNKEGQGDADNSYGVASSTYGGDYHYEGNIYHYENTTKAESSATAKLTNDKSITATINLDYALPEGYHLKVVRNDGTEVEVSSTNKTEFTLTDNLTTDGHYTYTVKVVNKSGDSLSEIEKTVAFDLDTQANISIKDSKITILEDGVLWFDKNHDGIFNDGDVSKHVQKGEKHNLVEYLDELGKNSFDVDNFDEWNTEDSTINHETHSPMPKDNYMNINFVDKAGNKAEQNNEFYYFNAKDSANKDIWSGLTPFDRVDGAIDTIYNNEGGWIDTSKGKIDTDHDGYDNFALFWDTYWDEDQKVVVNNQDNFSNQNIIVDGNIGTLDLHTAQWKKDFNDHFDIFTGKGDDSIVVNQVGNDSNTGRVTRNIGINMGDGDDYLYAQNGIVGRMWAGGSKWSDYWNTMINMGDGDNTVSIGSYLNNTKDRGNSNAYMLRQTHLSMGDGDDKLIAHNFGIIDDAHILTGGGDDYVDFSKARLDNGAILETGAGNDYVKLRQFISQVGGTHVSLGEGNDTIEIEKLDMKKGFIAGKSYDDYLQGNYFNDDYDHLIFTSTSDHAENHLYRITQIDVFEMAGNRWQTMNLDNHSLSLNGTLLTHDNQTDHVVFFNGNSHHGIEGESHDSRFDAQATGQYVDYLGNRLTKISANGKEVFQFTEGEHNGKYIVRERESDGLNSTFKFSDRNGQENGEGNFDGGNVYQTYSYQDDSTEYNDFIAVDLDMYLHQ